MFDRYRIFQLCKVSSSTSSSSKDTYLREMGSLGHNLNETKTQSDENKKKITVFTSDEHTIQFTKSGQSFRLEFDQLVSSDRLVRCMTSSSSSDTMKVYQHVIHGNVSSVNITIAMETDDTFIIEIYEHRLRRDEVIHCWSLQTSASITGGCISSGVLTRLDSHHAHGDTQAAEYGKIVRAQNKSNCIWTMARTDRLFSQYPIDYMTRVRKANQFHPLTPSGGSLDNIAGQQYRSFMGVAIPPQLFYEGIDKFKFSTDAAATFLKWSLACVLKVLQNQNPDTNIQWNKMTLKQRAQLVGLFIRWLPRLIAFTKDDPGHDCWTYPHMAPSILRAQADCEDLAALALFIIRLCLSVTDKKHGVLLYKICKIIQTKYISCGVVISSGKFKDDKPAIAEYDGLHMISMLIATSRFKTNTDERIENPKKEDQVAEWPTILLESMMNICPVESDDKGLQSLYKWQAHERSPSTRDKTFDAYSIQYVCDNGLYYDVYRLHVPWGPKRGEYVPQKRISVKDFIFQNPYPFVNYMQPSTSCRQRMQDYLQLYQTLCPMLADGSWMFDTSLLNDCRVEPVIYNSNSSSRSSRTIDSELSLQIQ